MPGRIPGRETTAVRRLGPRLLTSAPTWLPALLLLAVAANQLRLAHTSDLDPWKGGGFGMFSTSDHTPTRHTHLYVTPHGVGEERLDRLDALDDLEERLRALPSTARTEAFLRTLSGRLEDENAGHDAVRVEVWASHFDPETLRQRAVLLRDQTFRPDAAD